MSQSNVYQIIQDRQGFLWLATDDGLNKYDGYNFTVYRHQPFTREGLLSNQIFKLLQDKNGNIWIGASNGLNVLERMTETFFSLPQIPVDTVNSYYADVSALAMDKQGTIWVGSNQGYLQKIFPDSSNLSNSRIELISYFLKKKLSIVTLYIDAPGTVWVGTNNGLFYFDKSNKSWQLLNPDDTNNKSPKQNFIKCIFEDSKGKFWIRTTKALHELDRNSLAFRHYSYLLDKKDILLNDWESAIIEDSDMPGNLWLTSQTGLIYFNALSGEFKTYKHNPKDKNSIGADFTTAVLQDDFGVLWVACRGRGLFKADKSKISLNHFSHNPDNENSLIQNDVRLFTEDKDGNIWIGTHGGLDIFDPARNSFTHIKIPGDQEVVCLYIDSMERIWVGTYDGLYQYDRKKNTFTVIRNKNVPDDDQSSNIVFDISEDRKGCLWFATKSGLTYYNPMSGNFKRFRGNKQTSKNLYFRCIRKDGEKGLWLGSPDFGLFYFDIESQTYTQYSYNKANPNSISDNSVWAMHQVGDSVLWLITYGGGLNRLDIRTGKFKNFTTENAGFPTNNLDAMIVDNAGILWIGTDNGLLRFDPQSYKTRIFGLESGIQSLEFHQKSNFKSRDGRIYLGGINGFNAFYPADVYKINPIAPRLAVTDFKLFNKTVPIAENSPLSKSISLTKNILLEYDQNDISFEFVGLHFTQPHQNLYSFRLEPYEKDWHKNIKNREAHYTNLDPGKYIFSIKAANSDGIWNEQGKSIHIEILFPWWQRWWAYLIYLVSGISLLLFIRRYEMNRIDLRNSLKIEKIEAEKLKDLDQLKSRFFANISHEFRTPLTLVLGQIKAVINSDISSALAEKLKIAMRNAQRLLQLVSQLLDLSKLESGNMELNPVRMDIIFFLKNLFFTFESLAEEQKIELKFSSDVQKMIMDYEPEKMEMIITNLLSNALKFTKENGSVEMEVSLKDDLYIRIIDSGIGIPQDKLAHIFDRFYQVDSSDNRSYEGTGIGLALVKELVDLHNGKISVESILQKGTSFTVCLPLKQQGYHAQQKDRSGYAVSPEIQTVPYVQHKTEQVKDNGKPIVLVVEDNADLRSYIRDCIDPEYQVAEASDGNLGLQVAQKLIPDLIISDVMMPQMDGYTFVTHIRSDEKTSHIPVIMLTAKAADQDKLAGLKTGVDDYLVKPFNLEELLLRINNLITLRRNLRKKFATATVIRPNEISEQSLDQQFLKKILDLVEENLANENFTVTFLAEKVNMSEAQLNRKLNALIDQPPGQLIRSLRLQRAADLLKQRAGNVAEICYQVGFSDQANFTRSFKKQFGVSPSQYKNN